MLSNVLQINHMTKETEIVNEAINVRLPEELVNWIDSLVEKKLYRNRSEAIREFARDYILKNRSEEQR
jgi:Arc/MetJ-type ribon-helix-helix transcriptional regulator